MSNVWRCRMPQTQRKMNWSSAVGIAMRRFSGCRTGSMQCIADTAGRRTAGQFANRLTDRRSVPIRLCDRRNDFRSLFKRMRGRPDSLTAPVGPEEATRRRSLRINRQSTSNEWIIRYIGCASPTPSRLSITNNYTTMAFWELIQNACTWGHQIWCAWGSWSWLSKRSKVKGP